jgi:hypothetical protein
MSVARAGAATNVEAANSDAATAALPRRVKALV